MEKFLVVATFNVHKLAEIRAVLPGLRIKLKALSEFTGAVPACEDGVTLEENAVKKALAAARFTGCWALADDTGLEVDWLGGAPGVYSARYSGENASAAANNAKLLAALAGVPAVNRRARFICVTALASPEGAVKLSRGTLEGRVAERPRGKEGFGYDPLFEVGAGAGTLAELNAAEKNAISHRALALKALLPEINLL